MKTLFKPMLIASLCFSLLACGGSSDNNGGDTDTTIDIAGTWTLKGEVNICPGLISTRDVTFNPLQDGAIGSADFATGTMIDTDENTKQCTIETVTGGTQQVSPPQKMPINKSGFVDFFTKVTDSSPDTKNHITITTFTDSKIVFIIKEDSETATGTMTKN